MPRKSPQFRAWLFQSTEVYEYKSLPVFTIELLSEAVLIYRSPQSPQSNDIIEYYYTAIFVLPCAVFDSVSSINMHDRNYDLLPCRRPSRFSLCSRLMSESAQFCVGGFHQINIDECCLLKPVAHCGTGSLNHWLWVFTLTLFSSVEAYKNISGIYNVNIVLIKIFKTSDNQLLL